MEGVYIMKFELKRQEPVFIELCGKEYPARLTNRAVKQILELFDRTQKVESLLEDKEPEGADDKKKTEEADTPE